MNAYQRPSDLISCRRWQRQRGGRHVRISNAAGAMAGALGLRRNELEGLWWPRHDDSVCLFDPWKRGERDGTWMETSSLFFFALTWHYRPELAPGTQLLAPGVWHLAGRTEPKPRTAPHRTGAVAPCFTRIPARGRLSGLVTPVVCPCSSVSGADLDPAVRLHSGWHRQGLVSLRILGVHHSSRAS